MKISFFEKICHVALNENEFKTVNNLFVNNDSNDNNNNNFMLTTSFICFTLSVAVLNATVCQNERLFRDFKKKYQSVNYCFINNKIFDLIYDWVDISFKEEKFRLNKLIKNIKKSESSDFNNSLKISLLSVKNWLQLIALCLSK